MKTRQWMVILVLFCLIALAAVGLYFTRDTGTTTPAKARRAAIVDQRPIQTARKLAVTAATQAEWRLARQALRIADHEVDLAFAYEMRQAAQHPPKPTPETKEVFDRVSRAQEQLKTDQDIIGEIKKQIAAAAASERGALQQQLDLLQAQMELDEDELDDAKGDLLRSGADPLSLIQRQFARYQASQPQNEITRPQSIGDESNAVDTPSNLLAQIRAWYALRGRTAQLEQAREETKRPSQELKEKHDAMEQQSASAPKEANGQPVAGDSSAAVISYLKQRSDDQKNLSDLDKRIQDYQDLGEVYANWIVLVRAEQTAIVRGMIFSALLILLVVLGVYVLERLVDKLFVDLTPDKKRLRTLRVIIRFALQAVGLLLIVLVVVGAPSQISTIVGLAGAGLTVALKDFIVAFFGWFVLMGRNGLRVGDWVEINGVTGEVSEIGILRTVILETGNWNDAGHPTGRKVAFVNSFAIEGHFFNFSTSGQWLWDELQVVVPANEDPYPVIDVITKVVNDATAANAHAAEEEWKRGTNRRIQSFSAAPAINVRPTGSGVQVLVRYITRAQERYDMRTRLYQAVVDVLHGKKAVVGAAPTSEERQ